MYYLLNQIWYCKIYLEENEKTCGIGFRVILTIGRPRCHQLAIQLGNPDVPLIYIILFFIFLRFELNIVIFT